MIPFPPFLDKIRTVLFYVGIIVLLLIIAESFFRPSFSFFRVAGTILSLLFFFGTLVLVVFRHFLEESK